MGTTNFMIDRLTGRENYHTWSFAMENLLEHEGLHAAILGTENDVVKAKKAKAKLVLSIDPKLFVHIQSLTTAKEIWDKLKTIFEDNGLENRIGLIRTLVTSKLEDFSTVEEYINKIINTAHRLDSIGFTVPDEWVGSLMLAGLPDEYKPMIMALESSGKTITGDGVKTKLLQEIKMPNKDNDQAYLVKGKNKKKWKNDKYNRNHSNNQNSKSYRNNDEGSSQNNNYQQNNR